MNETEAIGWQLERYRTILLQQIDRLYNALEELQRTTLFLFHQESWSKEAVDKWLLGEGFGVDDDGFFQSLPLLSSFRQGSAPDDAISFSWGGHLKDDPVIRNHLYAHRNTGGLLKHIHDRLEGVGWIYYQDVANCSLQYPYIDQCKAIPSDFDWRTYHSFLSACPENNPERRICWTQPTVDYAGEGIIISVSIPVWDDDAFLGLWSIDLPLRYLYRDFSGNKAFNRQMQFITDCQGMLVLHDKFQAEVDQSHGRIFLNHLNELGGDWARVDMEELSVKSAGEITLRDETGEEICFCYCHIPGIDWFLFSGMPKSDMEQAAASRLQQAFRQISEGNFAYRIEASDSRALSQVVDEFNKMSVRLSNTEKERQRMEEQLRQAQKMEAIGRLAGGVAHDYNNMITIIMGYAELARTRLSPEDALNEDLAQIFQAAVRSKELTQQLLGFARCQPISPRVLNINATVSDMLRMLEPLIGEDLELTWLPGKDIGKICIDPTQIDQILTNLCVNARDAIDGAGKIVIETANAEIDTNYCKVHQSFKPGSFVCLSVSDDGNGIDPELLNNVFEPFFSTKAKGKGTGLGLSTVYGIVKQNNGFINIYSEPGQGTTFKIYLKRIFSSPAKQKHTAPATGTKGMNELIMVVEDNAGILSLSKRMLEQLGYRVLAVDSPLKAISMAKDAPEPIDLLITDVVMPDMNGRELSSEIGKICPELKVLFMSGYTSNVIVNRGVLDQDVCLLQKPFTKKEFAEKVAGALKTSGL